MEDEGRNVLLMLIDELEDFDDNKNYVKHRKYSFRIELISKETFTIKTIEKSLHE